MPPPRPLNRVPLTATLVVTCLALAVVGVATESSVVAEPPVTGVTELLLLADASDSPRVVLATAHATAHAVAPKQAVRRTPVVRKPVVRKPVVAPRPVATKTAAPRVAVAATRTAETAAERGNRVLRSLGYAWKELGYRIEFLPDKHGYLGLTLGGQKLIQVYVRTSESDLVLAHSIAHEIGHALDFTRGSPATHALYLTVRGLNRGLPWFGCSGCTDYQTPAGDWAEVFAYWLAGPGDFRSQVGGAPSATQLRQLNALFAA